MGARVLITGATGLIGRHLAPALRSAGHEVIAVSRSGEVPGATYVVEADLLDGSARAGLMQDVRPDRLIHLSWHDEPKGRWVGPENLDWAAATIDLVRQFAAQGGKRAVIGGSCAEYDWSNPVLGEDTPLAPATLYGQAKARTGQLLVAGAPALGISLAWARIFFVYGPGEPPGRLLGDLIAGLSRGEPVACTDGRQVRDFLHAADVAGALAALADTATVEGAVNVASGNAIPVRELIEETARQFGRPDLVRLGEIQRPAGDPNRIEARVEKLASTGFRPRFSLAEGIADCIRASEAGRP